MEWDLVVESEPAASARVRAEVAALEEALGRNRIVDLQVVLTELVTNAVKYGPREPIRIRLEFDGGSLHGWVDDRGAGRVAIREPHDPAEGGLGLRIVEALAQRWWVHPGSSQVFFDLE